MIEEVHILLGNVTTQFDMQKSKFRDVCAHKFRTRPCS